MSEDVPGAGATPPRRPPLRISDRDREVVADALREAYAEGRLTYEEHDERLGRVWQARTAADLEPLVEDLPVGGGVVPRDDGAGPSRGAAAGPGLPVPPPPPAAQPGGHGMHGVHGLPALPGGSGLALLSESTVRPPAGSREAAGAAVLGNLKVDLRDALGEGATGTFRLTVNALLGSAEVVVPLGVEVRVGGTAVAGSRQLHGPTGGRPGGPVLVVDGVALLGSVDVRRVRAED
ncbi:DUF1707 SHOCT-like domain-containing protein [Vallicoccus soli]|uniref:DUF1707 domain-containing protein n=1 Tax=Vallicoccus soli TaxID=2339232 RepID=A0A3A3Z7S9_9ACTN|nr:DUF1707 domain-containing protein [Vallicoccus soli]RJK97977.1 DUF1707 domain-containing protein [Vallicoccus soli]